MTNVNVLIGHFPITMGGANLVFSGLCHTFVPHFVAHMLKTLNVLNFCGTSVTQAEVDRSPYTRCLPNHAHTHAKGGENGSHLLPPSKSCLMLHIMRANYQTYIWRHSLHQFMNLPSPAGHGWHVMAMN